MLTKTDRLKDKARYSRMHLAGQTLIGLIIKKFLRPCKAA